MKLEVHFKLKVSFKGSHGAGQFGFPSLLWTKPKPTSDSFIIYIRQTVARGLARSARQITFRAHLNIV